MESSVRVLPDAVGFLRACVRAASAGSPTAWLPPVCRSSSGTPGSSPSYGASQRTDMRETQRIKGFRLPFSTLPTPLSGIALESILRSRFPGVQSRARTQARAHECERCTQECVRHGSWLREEAEKFLEECPAHNSSSRLADGYWQDCLSRIGVRRAFTLMAGRECKHLVVGLPRTDM